MEGRKRVLAQINQSKMIYVVFYIKTRFMREMIQLQLKKRQPRVIVVVGVVVVD